MTTVVVCDGVMAADRQATRMGLRANMSKILRAGPDMLIGRAGNLPDMDRLLEWFIRGEKNLPCEFKCYGDEKPNARLLVLSRGGPQRYLVSCVTHWLSIEPIGEPFWAIGSGAEAALAAMHMGADARRAVEIAHLVDVDTGGGIEVVAL